MNNVAMAQAVQRAAKPKFRGHTVLKSKVVTHFPDNLAREYERITNAYMALLNKTLAEHLPTIRRAIDAEREGMRRDDIFDILGITKAIFDRILREFERKAVTFFGLDKKIENLANLTQKLSTREWKRVVHKTLGIDIMEDYYKGEFFRNNLKLWVQKNVDLITSIPQDTLGKMKSIVEEGYLSGRHNTAIAKEIQEAYGIEKHRAQFIARDQMANLNAEITKTQQEDAGVVEYVWSTSDDERVRKSHRELDGTRQNWSDPPIVDARTGRRAHPGEDYQCRCVALPVFNLPGLDLPWEKGAQQ